MKQHSIKYNAIMNTIKSIMAVIFPLITFPYACRVLGIVNVGKINFVESVITYFVLIASLGINNYAVREGAALRDDDERLKTFVSDIFSINVLSTTISYILLFVSVLCIEKLQNYVWLIIIQSLIIFATTLGVEWFFSLTEDFYLITVRSILVQLLSLFGLFIFVKDANDYYLYAGINVVASTGGNVFNYIYARKRCRFVFSLRLELIQHIKPILLLFASNIMMVIYVNSDITILGFLCGDYEVGLYSTSVKIYKIIKQIINAIIVVSLPRLSYYLENQKYNEYTNLLQTEVNVLLILIFPCIIGLEFLAESIIIIVGGREYVNAVPSLQMLGIGIIFSLLSSFVITSILLPRKQEKICFYVSFVSAIVNLGLNFIFIPLYMSVGAALTTVIAEAVVLFMSVCYARSDLKKIKVLKNITQSIVGCAAMIVVIKIVDMFFNYSILIDTVIAVISGASVYFLVLIILRNKLVTDFLRDILKNDRRKNDSFIV